MPKPNIHPTWYPEAKVYCDGELVATVGSTKPELHVDVWAGNHPFFTGTQKIIDTEGRVDRFMRKYGMGGEGEKLQRRGVRTKKSEEAKEPAKSKATAKNSKKRK
ncbi:MAG: 50S ribosomal protein L31 [Pseudanabaenaceae cyanobacterium SKYGB_i_bin29]|nr:50S ribosomal protein L31 [Pseudanabaenaceae cyanobacterium SKYG29]MDW8421888.1 50S ribosomal protein L31 [Pseudanabaenaceae cyanobacterium SKYGB_i_bin29]